MRAWWAIIIFAIISFSFLPTFYEIKRSVDLSPERSFELVHNYITDYNFYLSRIREGWDGRWTVIERYTNEPHNDSLIQEFYLLLGRTVRTITNPNEAVMCAYYAAVLIGAILLLACTAWAATVQFRVVSWSLFAFLLAVFASGWPIVVPVGTSWRFGGYMAWFTVVDILQRITFLPHVLVGQAMIVILLFLGNNQLVLQKKGNVLFLGFFALLLGMIFPPGLVFVGGAYFCSIWIELLWMQKKGGKSHMWAVWWKEHVLPRLVIGVISLPAIAYYSFMLRIYPWKQLVDFDQLHPLRVSVFEYIKVLGPVLPLGLIGLVVAFIKKERVMLPSITWILSWILLFGVFTFIPQQSPLRFAEMAPHIALAFCTIYLSITSISYIKKRHISVYAGVVAFAVPLLCIVLGMGVMYSSWLWHKDFVNQKVIAGWPAIPMNNYIVYPSSAFIEGIDSINYITVPDSVILGELVAGNYIPARTGRRVYVGHDNSVKKEEKLILAQQFFQGGMDSKNAYFWLKSEGITHVFYGPQEQEDGKGIDIVAQYPYLRQIFEKNGVKVFEVQ